MSVIPRPRTSHSSCYRPMPPKVSIYQVDRSLQVHTLAGCIYDVKIPRFGRDLAYVRERTEALIPSVGLASDGSGLWRGLQIKPRAGTVP